MGETAGYRTECVHGLRELLKFQKSSLDYLHNLSRSGIDVLEMIAGKRRIYFVNHPNLIRDVLVTHDWNFIKGRALLASKPVFGNGLLTSEGELHRRQRRLAQPAFHSTRLEEYARAMVESCIAACRGWSEGEQIAVDRQMMILTLQIVGRTLFSADLLREAKQIGDEVTGSLLYFRLLNNPFLQNLPILSRWIKKYAGKSRRRFEALVSRVVTEHRQYPDRYNDILSLLITPDDEMGAGFMSDELLLDEVVTLFLAGHETTANALSWTWCLLAQHLDAERKLHEEIETVLQGRPPAIEDVPRLVFTAQILREVLRLYPPAWLITREAITRYKLGPVEVPPGANLMVSPYATHRDQRFWDAPDTFAPERWEGNGCAEQPKFAYFPFGAGTRVCIGEHFAMLEGVLLIAAIAQQWRLHLVPKQKIVPNPQITLRPRGCIFMKLQAR